MSYYKLKAHRGLKHEISIVGYGDGDQYAVECDTCNEVLVSFDAPPEPVQEPVCTCTGRSDDPRCPKCEPIPKSGD